MNLIECPGCGAEIDEVPLERTSEAFCPACDFPVFFASGPVVRVPVEDGSRERNPGVAGRVRRVAVACPVCAEPNPRDGLHCLRCGALLSPPPPTEPEVEVVPEPEPAPEPPPPPPNRWWIPFLVGVLVGSLVTLLAVLLAVRIAG